MSQPLFKTLDLRLINEQKQVLNLRFSIRATALAQRWARLLKQDLSFGIRENDRFQGFYKDPKTGIDHGIKRVLFLIEKLKPLHPEIQFGEIDFSDVQKEVNRLHVNFADRHLVKKDLSEQSFQHWNDLNVVLHQMESYLYDLQKGLGKKTGKKTEKKPSFSWKLSDLFGLIQAKWKKKTASSQPTLSQQTFPRGDLTLTFYNQNKEDLSDRDFEENMVLNQTFGCIYVNYAQVGRHIMELWWSQDENLPVEHIQPFQKLSSDFMVYFGPSFGHSDHLYLLEEIKSWFLKREEYFAQLDLTWDPVKLRLGFLPLAFLSPPCWSLEEARALREKISHFQKVESVSIA